MFLHFDPGKQVSRTEWQMFCNKTSERPKNNYKLETGVYEMAEKTPSGAKIGGRDVYLELPLFLKHVKIL